LRAPICPDDAGARLLGESIATGPAAITQIAAALNDADVTRSAASATAAVASGSAAAADGAAAVDEQWLEDPFAPDPPKPTKKPRRAECCADECATTSEQPRAERGSISLAEFEQWWAITPGGSGFKREGRKGAKRALSAYMGEERRRITDFGW
jgi:hypothetical protein